MRFFAFASIALAGAAAAAPFVKRDYPTLQADVQDIAAKLGDVNSALKAFDKTTKESALVSFC